MMGSSLYRLVDYRHEGAKPDVFGKTLGVEN
jgi:hypothetical protein